MGQTIACANQKGGVGKTTTVVNLAAFLALASERVLVIDLDPQGNATSGLGLDRSSLETSVYDGVIDGLGLEDVMVEGPLGIDVVPSAIALAGAEVELAPLEARERRLARLIGAIAPRYDYVLVDCPPSLGLLTVNGLFAADCALVVTEPGAWATDGVAQMLRTIERISERRREPLGVAGIVVNRLGRTRDGQYWYQQLAELYPRLVLPPVHLRAAIAEAAAQSLPLHMLGPRPGAAEAAAEFDALFRRVVLATRPRPGGSVDAEL